MFGKRKLESILRLHDGDVRVVGSASRCVLGQIRDVKKFVDAPTENKPEWYKKARRADVTSVKGSGVNETTVVVDDGEEFLQYSESHLGNRQLELIGAVSMLWYEGFVIVIDDKKGNVLGGEPGLYRIDNATDLGRLIRFIKDNVSDKRSAATRMLMSLNGFNKVDESAYPFNTLMIWAEHRTKSIPAAIASPEKKYWVPASKNAQVPYYGWIEDGNYYEDEPEDAADTSDGVDDSKAKNNADDCSEQTIDDICKEVGLEPPKEKDFLKDFQPDPKPDVVDENLFA